MSGTTVDRLNGVTDGIAIKAPCRAATTANITLSGEQTIDGVAVVSGNRVLVKNQTDTTTNGIYSASTGTWTRAYDFDGTGDIVQGTQVFVFSGTTNANTRWQITTASPAIGSALAFDTTAVASLDINSLSAETAPAVADTVPFYDASAAANRKITLENLVKIINALTAETAPAVGDEVAIYDASAAAPRKMTLENALKVIAALTGLTAPAVDDVLAIYDLSATSMKSITTVDLLEVLNVLTEDTTPDGAADFVLAFDTSAGTVKKVKPNNLSSSGKIAQIVTTTWSTATSNTATIPTDNTIPQNTEGTERFTLSITPTNASSTLLVEAYVHSSINVLDSVGGREMHVIAALFRDTTANAIGVAIQSCRSTAANESASDSTLMHICASVAATSTSLTTFKIRTGIDDGSADSEAAKHNQSYNSETYGGMLFSSMTITEILP